MRYVSGYMICYQGFKSVVLGLAAMSPEKRVRMPLDKLNRNSENETQNPVF